MDNQLINEICEKVYRSHPEVRGCKPKMQGYSDIGQLLIFQTKTRTENGRELTHTIRVVVSEDGKIKKITTSR